MSNTLNAKQAEGFLGALYSSIAVLSTISIVCLAVPWHHWAWTLDVCMEINCGCILYGVNTFSTFIGGNVKICYLSTYGPIPILLYGLCLGIYHGYRSCIPRGPDNPKVVTEDYTLDNRDFMSGVVVVVRSKPRSPCKQWVLACFLAAVLGFLTLAHAIVLTDGFFKTCGQYRKNLVKILGSGGRELQVIHDRLSCGAIFDFMDYLQPDTNDWRRGNVINTGISLQFAIAASWLNFFAWIWIFIINFIMARRRVKRRREKFCCFC